MLDAEARALLDLMDAATKGGRPRLETLPHSVGRKAVDKISEDGEAEPPEVAEATDGGFAGPASEIRFRRYNPPGSEGVQNVLRKSRAAPDCGAIRLKPPASKDAQPVVSPPARKTARTWSMAPASGAPR